MTGDLLTIGVDVDNPEQMARSWRWFRSKIETVLTTPPDYIQVGSPFDRIKVVPVYRTRTQIAVHGLPDLTLDPAQ